MPYPTGEFIQEMMILVNAVLSMKSRQLYGDSQVFVPPCLCVSELKKSPSDLSFFGSITTANLDIPISWESCQKLLRVPELVQLSCDSRASLKTLRSILLYLECPDNNVTPVCEREFCFFPPCNVDPKNSRKLEKIEISLVRARVHTI